MQKRFSLIIFLLLAVGVLLKAQTERFFSGDQYLGGSTVNDLLQDHWGRIWIATQGGLTRYDSHEFRTYSSNDGLVDNHVTRLVQDKNDIVIGTTHGAQRFSLATLRFQHIRLFSGKQEKSTCYVNALLRRRNGDILIATSGVGLFVMKSGASTAHYSDRLIYPELIDVKDMQEAADGTLWFAANHCGVLRIRQGKMTVFLKGKIPMTNVCVTRKGNVYACGMNGGLFKYDAVKNDFLLEKGTERMTVNRLTEKLNGNLLVATEEQGNRVNIIFEDRDGNQWVGISQKGLLLKYNQKNSFDYIGSRSTAQNYIGDNCVSAVFRDSKGVLWVGTNGDGLYRIENGVSRHYDRVSHHILCICEGRQGRLYIGSWQDGCGLLDQSTGRYERIEGTTKGDAVHAMSMVVDGENNLWIATNGDGLKCLNLQTGKLTRYDALTVSDPNGQENQLTNAWINGLSLSPDGRRLYLAMSSGVGCMDLSTHSFVRTFGRNCLLSGHAVNAVREERNGTVWVAAGDGLYKIYGGKIVKIRTRDGLPNSDILSLEFGDKDQLWLGTQHGLACFDMRTGTCSNYFLEDGLQGNEFFKGASCRLSDGRLAFGGIGGLTLFRPSDISLRPTSVHVQLTDMFLGGQEVCTLTHSGWHQVCDTLVSEAKCFDLAYYDNSPSFYFSTMDYAHADGLQYEYRIGADGIWQRLPMGVNVLTLSHLSPATYQVRVRVVAGRIVSDELNFIVRVHPAWYASGYAKIVYGLLVILMIWRYLYHRRRTEQQRLRVQEHIHAAQMRKMESGYIKEDSLTPASDSQMEETMEAEHREIVRQTFEDKVEKLTLQTPDERLLEQVMQVVNAHITDTALSVEQIAHEVGLSRSHLHRKMKELTGESTRDFVRNVRLKRAAYLLEGGKHSIAEVMYACGFDSPSGFSTRFKTFYGVSPSEYMKEHSYSKTLILDYDDEK